MGRAPESVTVEIRNVAGMVVQTVPVNNAEIGLNRVLWNGMGATGTKMPNGRYIMAVTAVALDNQETARAISSVTIER